MFKQNAFSYSLGALPATWKPLFSLGLVLLSLGLLVLLFSRVIVIILAMLCFFASFSFFRAALRAYLGMRRQPVDIIEIN